MKEGRTLKYGGGEGKDGWTNNHKGYVLKWCLCSLASAAPRIWPKPRDKYLSRLLSMRAFRVCVQRRPIRAHFDVSMGIIKEYKGIKGMKSIIFQLFQGMKLSSWTLV